MRVDFRADLTSVVSVIGCTEFLACFFISALEIGPFTAGASTIEIDLTFLQVKGGARLSIVLRAFIDLFDGDLAISILLLLIVLIMLRVLMNCTSKSLLRMTGLVFCNRMNIFRFSALISAFKRTRAVMFSDLYFARDRSIH